MSRVPGTTLTRCALAWLLSRRAKQYAGNVSDTVGGITLDIGRDIVGGPLAR